MKAFQTAVSYSSQMPFGSWAVRSHEGPTFHKTADEDGRYKIFTYKQYTEECYLSNITINKDPKNL